MTDVWTGDILLPDGDAIGDIALAAPHGAYAPTIPPRSLRFLCTVNTARIPLYLSVGPSLDVWTTSQETEAWFESLLLSKAACQVDASRNWCTSARAQSPVGILVEVENEEGVTQRPRVTEILFYGTITALPNGSLPTPPSSSPERNDGVLDLPELRVHAIPLSSDLLNVLGCVNDEEVVKQEAQFLPTAISADHEAPGSPKRKRDIFDEATQAKQKARRKGGEGVAAAAARSIVAVPTLAHRKSLSIDTKAMPVPDARPLSANDSISRPLSRSHSRSPSISSDYRPLSRAGPLTGGSKRSALSRVESISLQPEEPTLETRNKEALSRVVMAGMRMYGLQQRRKNRSRRESFVGGGEGEGEGAAGEGAAGEGAVDAIEEAARDEEYKVIYHQTFKGAVLAFRHHTREKPLHSQPETLRRVVESLLAVFCVDPLGEGQ